MDTTGGEVKDSVEALSEDEAQQKIRQMGYFVTKITEVAGKKGGGLPVLCSLKTLEHQMKPGVLKNSLIDVVDDVESGITLSEAFGKHPKCFDRLYVNMVKA